ncbi:MAG: hypothetical protein LBJ62_10530 [Bifidobacteriaceae bacterium]|jgi:hypothetical protein|nr:hypothetical protein [Bifidobacteriaceae bacterium]
MPRLTYVKRFTSRQFWVMVLLVTLGGMALGGIGTFLVTRSLADDVRVLVVTVTARPTVTETENITVTAAAPLEVGICLTLTPGDFRSSLPQGWQNRAVACSDPRAGTEVVSVGQTCPDNVGCQDVENADQTFQIYALPPREGSCFPGYRIIDAASGSTEPNGVGYPTYWMRCVGFEIPSWFDTTRARELAAEKYNVGPDRLEPVTLSVEQVSEDKCTSEQWSWNSTFNQTEVHFCTNRP